jgi:hypothetical protein
MTIVDEGRKLRDEVAKLRPDQRRRYPAELRQRLRAWVARAEEQGISEVACGKAVRIKTWRFKLWREAAARSSDDQTESTDEPESSDEGQSGDGEHPEPLALVRVGTAATSGLVLVAPTGHRIEGLTVEQALALLRGVS